MSLLERVIRGHRCRSTHHYIAFDALSLIAAEEGGKWKSLFLVHHEHLFDGAKAPDTKFKDFQNHVLHVGEGEWGGAPDKAMEWYATAVEHLRARRWSKAVYAFGVMSHYYADPVQPFHTGQTEEEGVIHRAVEWSIAKSRPAIDAWIAAHGYPDVTCPEGAGFVADMVRAGANLSHPHYQTFIDHYDIEAGAKKPEAGMDDVMLEAVCGLIAHATAGFAVLVSRGIAEAGVAPPKTSLTLQGYIETLDIPLRWVTSKLSDMADRRQVEAMYKEYRKTGKVIRTLPEDDKAIRKLHARNVLRKPLKELDKQAIGPIGSLNKAVETRLLEELIIAEAAGEAGAAPAPEAETAAESVETRVPEMETVEEVLFETDETRLEATSGDQEATGEAPVEGDRDAEPEAAPPSTRLSEASPVVDAPSIGKKTAKRLARAGITTTGDLLACDVDETAFLVDAAYIDAETLNDWKDQTRLMMDVPGLRVHDVQILVGAGIRTRQDLAEAPARTLFMLATEFLMTPEGDRVYRDDDYLAEEEVEGWIGMAKAAPRG